MADPNYLFFLLPTLPFVASVTSTADLQGFPENHKKKDHIKNEKAAADPTGRYRMELCWGVCFVIGWFLSVSLSRTPPLTFVSFFSCLDTHLFPSQLTDTSKEPTKHINQYNFGSLVVSSERKNKRRKRVKNKRGDLAEQRWSICWRLCFFDFWEFGCSCTSISGISTSLAPPWNLSDARQSGRASGPFGEMTRMPNPAGSSCGM